MSHGCGSGGCGCASTGNEKETGASTLTAEQAVAYEALATAMEAAPVAQSSQAPAGVAQVMPVAAINGIAGLGSLFVQNTPNPLIGPLPVGIIGSIGFALAAGLGFEPRQTESESVVLPLHYPAISIWLARKILS